MKIPKRQMGLWAAGAALLYVPQAYAYLDPVTGSMIIQGLIGAVAGATVALNLYWRRLKAWFGRVTGRPPVGHEHADQRAAQDVAAAEKD